MFCEIFQFSVNGKVKKSVIFIRVFFIIQCWDESTIKLKCHVKHKKRYQHTILLCTGHGEGQHKCRKWSPQKEELPSPNRLNAFCFKNVSLKSSFLICSVTANPESEWNAIEEKLREKNITNHRMIMCFSRGKSLNLIYH